MPDTIDPQRLIDALTANGWTITGRRADAYVRLELPGEERRSLVVPVDATAHEFRFTLGAVLADLARRADTGRRAAAVLASLGTTPTVPAYEPPAGQKCGHGHDPRHDGSSPLYQRVRCGCGCVACCYDFEAPDVKQIPSADSGPTHRAQSSSRLAWEIARDLRAAGRLEPDVAPLMAEAADKLEHLSSVVADECMARNAAERATGRAEAELEHLNRVLVARNDLVELRDDEIAEITNQRDQALAHLRGAALTEHHRLCGESSQWDIRRCEDADCTARGRLLAAHGLIPKEWDTYPIPTLAGLDLSGAAQRAIDGWRPAGGVPQWTPIDPATVDGMHECFAVELGALHHPHIYDVFDKRIGCPGVGSKATVPKFVTIPGLPADSLTAVSFDSEGQVLDVVKLTGLATDPAEPAGGQS